MGGQHGRDHNGKFLAAAILNLSPCATWMVCLQLLRNKQQPQPCGQSSLAQVWNIPDSKLTDLRSYASTTSMEGRTLTRNDFNILLPDAGGRTFLRIPCSDPAGSMQ